MTALPLSELRADLASLIQGVGGLRVSAYMQPKPEPPAATIRPRRGDYLADFDGEADHELEIYIYINGADLLRAQQSLDEYLSPSGPKSIAAVVNASGRYRCLGYDDYGRQLDEAGSQLFVGLLQVGVIG